MLNRGMGFSVVTLGPSGTVITCIPDENDQANKILLVTKPERPQGWPDSRSRSQTTLSNEGKRFDDEVDFRDVACNVYCMQVEHGPDRRRSGDGIRRATFSLKINHGCFVKRTLSSTVGDLLGPLTKMNARKAPTFWGPWLWV